MKIIDEIQKFTYQGIGNLLLDLIPEYKSIIDADQYQNDTTFGNYLFLNSFATYLAIQIENNETEFLSKSFNFINQLAESNNLEILNLLKVGILEILYTSGNNVRLKTYENLNEKALSIFSELSKYYV